MVDFAPTMQIDPVAFATCFSEEPPAKRAKLLRASSGSDVSTVSTAVHCDLPSHSAATPLFESSPVTQSPLSDSGAPPSPGKAADTAASAGGAPGGADAGSFATGAADGWTEETLVRVLTNDVEDLCNANDAHVSGQEVPEGLKMFFSQYKQPFPMDFYIERLVQYSNCSASAFVAALVYLDRIHVRCPMLSVTEMNCHRLLSTALVIAIKYLDDEVYANAYYARVSGLTMAELNALEAKMLDILGWRLHISVDEFSRYEDSLLKSAVTIEDSAAGAPALEDS